VADQQSLLLKEELAGLTGLTDSSSVTRPGCSPPAPPASIQSEPRAHHDSSTLPAFFFSHPSWVLRRPISA
jgi:hypothetical protein